MPGLFGIVDLGGGQDRRAGDQLEIFDRLATFLNHDPEEVVDRWIAPPVFIGRIGAPHLHHVPWPPADVRRSRQTFAAGLIHNLPAWSELESSDGGPIDTTALAGVNGFFSIAQHDPTSRQFVLAADRRGSFPIYYGEVDGCILFAPETLALLADPQLNRALDEGAAANLISTGHLLGEQTLLAGVRRLRGGEALIAWGDGRWETQRYWSFRPGSQARSRSSQHALASDLAHLIRRAVRRNLANPDETVIFLSGGADSRGILGAALDSVDGDGRRLNTVSWGASRGGPTSDVAIADQIATTAGVRHRFIERTVADYGRDFAAANGMTGSASDVGAYHPMEYRIMQRLRAEGFRSAIRGDEAFGWSIEVRDIAGAMHKVLLRRFGDDPSLAHFLRPEHRDRWRTASDRSFDRAAEEVAGLPPNDAKDRLYFSHRFQGYLNTASYFKLPWVDQRNVLLDDEILEFLEYVPWQLRIEKELYQRAMRLAFPGLWAIPIAKSSNLENWSTLIAQEGPVREFICASIDDDDSPIWHYVDQAALRELAASARAEPTHDRRSSTLRWIFFRLPRPIVRRARGWRAAHDRLRLPRDKTLLRFLVLKQFADNVAGHHGAPPRSG